MVITPGQVKTIEVTHGGAATEEFTVRSLSIRQRYGSGLVQQTLMDEDYLLSRMILVSANRRVVLSYMSQLSILCHLLRALYGFIYADADKSVWV